jgi:rhodanese-related sulfurtransferase
MRKLVILVLALLSAGLLTAGCSSATGTAPATNTRVDVSRFNEVVTSAGTQVIDVRTPAEFAAGHLANAVNIDFEAPTFSDEIGKLDKSATYAVYCRSGNRSRTAAQQMANAGFTTIYELEGGITAWTAAGLATIQ